jgi:hypothetical protein
VNPETNDDKRQASACVRLQSTNITAFRDQKHTEPAQVPVRDDKTRNKINDPGLTELGS